ncbi:MAG: 50S ribosomal protein L9 [Omnitrophica WOR_2 bacterium RIFOXYA2_FULL_45_12]|nr:MAG: 50S ribosomal protein L9 [Omnitrophica WOR_2 bacterium RIFOXYA2_FULL_45_12]HBU09017.1 50S ribosomal protein L9 [Candidatus Omnitrophota bacterium]
MKVILKQDVEKLGKAWDVVSIKDGYARNFLFPRGLILAVTKENLKLKEKLEASKAVLEEKNKKEAQGLAKKLLTESFTLTREATAEDKLYGSIDAQELEKLLKSEGYDIDKKNILLTEPIKSLGAYTVDLKLHPEVTATIKVWVVKK